MKKAKKSLASKTEIDNGLCLGKKSKKKKIEKLLIFYSSYFLGKSHFEG